MTAMTLLLVDDEERFLSTSKILLEKRGINTLTATNGLDALNVLDERRVDVVILDVKMPGMDGVQALREVKRRHPLIEVIMLTGHASVESAVEGLKLGAFDYVMKPCDVPDLVEKARQACERKRAMEEKIQRARVEQIISHPMAVFDKKTELE